MQPLSGNLSNMGGGEGLVTFLYPPLYGVCYIDICGNFVHVQGPESMQKRPAAHSCPLKVFLHISNFDLHFTFFYLSIFDLHFPFFYF